MQRAPLTRAEGTSFCLPTASVVLVEHVLQNVVRREVNEVVAFLSVHE